MSGYDDAVLDEDANLTILAGAPIEMQPFADLAMVLDKALDQWRERRMQDDETPHLTKCCRGCGAPACIGAVINDTLQFLAAQILTEGMSDTDAAVYINEVSELWPKAVVVIRAVLAGAGLSNQVH